MDVVPTLVGTTPVGADGPTVSGHDVVNTLTVVRAETFPAASKASTLRLYAPLQAIPV
jgi:hypothetical protein